MKRLLFWSESLK